LEPTIGIAGTGDMGSAVGRVLRDSGLRVITSLAGRSGASRALAADAGFEDLGSLTEVVNQCDVFLSILPPSAAFDFAEHAARLIAAAAREIVYVDCNAVSPATVQRIADLFAGGPARFVDVGIVGPAPRPGEPGSTRFYVSGEFRNAVLSLTAPEIRGVDLGDSIGQASALKMCYAALNKGTNAMLTNLLLAARKFGIDNELLAEFAESQPEAMQRIERRIPFLAADAERFAGEMAEIAAAFDAAGVSGDFYRGARWLFEVLARSELAAETRASQPSQRSLEQAMRAFSAVIED
jgi:3-hydroxyisobutyrate dehydrogenase-like beta-hydroxyacid dehydrogenase